jgi:hypothetical protein
MRRFVIGFIAGVIFSMAVAGTIYPNVATDIMSGEIKSATVKVTQEWFNEAMEWLENGLWE